MTIKELLNQAVIMLKNENIDAPKNKARMLLQATLKKSREYLMIYDNKEVENIDRDRYIKNVKRLILGEPLQYITGIQEVIRKAENISNPVILDLCTGSGAIAVSLAKYIKNVHICAVDISSKALEIAKKNAELNGVKNNIEFIESNLFDKIKERKFDIIVSNPPYIETETIKTLSKEVQSEPKIALDGGKDGLDFYRKIADSGSKYLNRQGYICLEIGYNQRIAVRQILENKKRYVNINCIKDLCGNDRVITAQIG